MTDSDTEYAVETPTEYDDDPDCTFPLEILIEDIDREQATYIAQQLSLFMETNDPEALERFATELKEATNEEKSSVIQRYEGGSATDGLRWDSEI